jgi:hypothetical protein
LGALPQDSGFPQNADWTASSIARIPFLNIRNESRALICFSTKVRKNESVISQKY